MPRVAIITRTQKRPYLLKRAIVTMSQQFYKDYVLVIVNDGGKPNHVDLALKLASKEISPKIWKEFLKKIKIIHHKKPRGMEAASNSGIKNSDSEFIVIHDDDNTWHPLFLKETVNYLKKPPHPSIKGVITKTLLIVEKLISGGKAVNYLDAYPFKPSVSNWDVDNERQTPRQIIEIKHLLKSNLFPPISFLYARKVWEEIGGYDETFPVIGDWKFNLCFILRKDIGIIHSYLAHYHHRTTLTERNELANTVISQKKEHSLYSTLLKNQIYKILHSNK